MTASEEQVAAATMSTVEVPEETMSTVDSPEQMAAAEASRRHVQALDSVRSPATAGAQKIQAMRTPKAERDRILRVRP